LPEPVPRAKIGAVSTASRYDEVISLPRAVRFPVEMIPPPHFDPERLETWPEVVGRLEYVDGRLLYMPPCGDFQQDTATDVVITLGEWVRRYPEFVLGTNEAGMRLGGATRAADAAVWRRADLGPYEGGLRRVPPILAVEIGGADEGDQENALRAKAEWYSSAGVTVVWIVLPRTQEVLVLTAEGETRLSNRKRIRAHPALPGLSPKVSDFFVQIRSRG
jgi:Uma2 family endonuclease